ncbi:hypothetical protein [Chryseobacterium gwangjuense]|uniref:hypothetical protein n=1 Tax=Chryseobacterium gwangjuense TaxID=1069980 RepID=UPI001E5C51C7|nr:hypothetical protein [Chryseobacterium gwangjuense]MCE3076306.1 hypothetical protein [Chryseobacterium gwangjuense]
MKISSKIQEINEILVDYEGDEARIWLFDISHTKLGLKIYSNKKEEVIYLVISGCKHIKGSFSVNNPKFIVTESFDSEITETVFKILDKSSDFELVANSGIALAKGLDEEFGNSFEDFLKE